MSDLPMKGRVNYSSGVAWEPMRGYARAVRVADTLYVSGTTAMTPAGDIVGVGDAYQQAAYILQLLRNLLRETGFLMSDVVRTRVYLTDIADWKVVARAHREVFEKIRPASSIVQVAKLVDPRLKVEMELEAVLGCPKEVELVSLSLTPNK